MEHGSTDGPALTRRAHWAEALATSLAKLTRLALGRRRALWIALAVVVTPLLLLLGFQYLWLVDLQRNSVVAHRAALQVQLDLLAKQIALHFQASGERTLRLPPWIFLRTCDCFDKFVFDHIPAPGPAPQDAAVFERWLTAPGQGARSFVLVPLGGAFQGQVFAYDLRKRVRLDEGSLAPATRLALYYAQMRAHKMPASVNPKDFVVDESDPGHPLILSYVADEQSQLVGITAMVLEVDFFAKQTLPALLQRGLRSDGAPQDLAVSVWDGAGDVVIADSGTLKPRFETKRKLGFVFTRWIIALGSRRSTGAEIARTNFIVNVTLSTILASVLLAGIALAMRTAAREMKLSEIKSDFVSNVSHELRTPLSSIRVFGELMRLGRVSDPAKVREYGEYIESEGRRLSRLIDNILDFSRIESGGKLYQLEEHDLAEVVTDVLQTFELRLRREGFVVELNTPSDPLPPVRIDEAAIGHALGNLIDNAVKYSGVARRLAVTVAGADAELVVGVRDFGIGIPREEHERIFERFHRVGTGLVHDVKGSGLGLAIVKHIAEAHGGRVTVESSPGHGSLFALHLPLLRDEALSRLVGSG